jgi:hypothetical protein
MRAHKTATSPLASGAETAERNTTGSNNWKRDTETKDSTNEAIPNLEYPVLTSAKRPVYLRNEDAERYSPKCVEGVFCELPLYGVRGSSGALYLKKGVPATSAR